MIPLISNAQFPILSQNLDFKKHSRDTVMQACAKNCDKKIVTDQNLFIKYSTEVNNLVLAKMEEDFNSQFTEKEKKYLETLFQHDLLKRVFKFRGNFLKNEKTQKMILEELLKRNKLQNVSTADKK